MSFTTEALSKEGMDAVLNEFRHLWLYAPNSIIESSNTFLDAIEFGKGDAEREEALADFILLMREDTSFYSLLIPQRRRGLLRTAFRLRTAKSSK